MQRQIRRAGIVCGVVCVAGLLMSPVEAGLRFFARTVQTIDGVNALGSPSALLGNKKAQGKVYKDLDTGVVLMVAQGMVDNAFGYGKIFKNRGLTMIDPATKQFLVSTSDVTLIYKRKVSEPPAQGETGWGASEIKTFVP